MKYSRAIAAFAAPVLAFSFFAAALTSAVPARADGAASTRNIILLSAAGAVPLVVNYNHKERIKRQQRQEMDRRQDAYRDWFYHKYGYYPTYDQFKQWYVQTYNTNPG